MSLRTSHSAFRIRAGHTLVELLVAMVSGSMLLAALASTMYIAGQVAYSPLHAQRLLQSTSAAFDLAEELKHATYIVDYGATYIEFVTDDRNGDGIEESHRYEWSAVPGDPLVKTLNRGSPATVLDDVHDFHLDYAIAQGSEQIDVVAMGSEVQIGSLYDHDDDFELDENKHLAQSIDLSGLPTSAVSWAWTGVRYRAEPAGGGTGGQFAIQLRTATWNGTPTSEILAEYIIQESSLGSGGWFTLTPPAPVAGLSPHGSYCIVFARISGRPAKIGLTDNAGGASETYDNGATWSLRSPSRRARMIVYARPVVPDTPLTLPQDRLQSVKISLQRTPSTQARIDTAARLENAPLLAHGMVATEFDKDPTIQDANGDGSGDFAQAGGGSFDTSSLTDGWWNASSHSTRLIGGLSDDATLPVDVRFRAQAIGVGSYGATVTLHLRLSATETGQVAANLSLNSDGTQALDVASYNGSTYTRLGRVDGITAEPVEVRLVADPVRRICVYFIDGVQYPSVTFPAYSETRTRHEVMVFETSSDGRFDYVHATQPKDG